MQNLTQSYLFTHALEIRIAMSVFVLLGIFAIIKGAQFLSSMYTAYVSKVQAMRSTTGRLSSASVR